MEKEGRGREKVNNKKGRREGHSKYGREKEKGGKRG